MQKSTQDKAKQAKHLRKKKTPPLFFFFFTFPFFFHPPSRRQPRVVDPSDDLVEDPALHPVDRQLVHPVHASEKNEKGFFFRDVFLR